MVIPNVTNNVILLRNGEHLCTCSILVTHGIVCRHVFKIFVESNQAYFHILLIPNRWYQDQFINNSDLLANEMVVNTSEPAKEGELNQNIQYFERTIYL